MENKGRYIVLFNCSKYVINYVEKGYVRALSLIDEKYAFDEYELANDYIKNNKEELNQVISKIKKEEEKRLMQMLEEERKATEKVFSKNEKKNKKNKDRRTSTRGKAWFLAGVASIPVAYTLYRGIVSMVADVETGNSLVNTVEDLKYVNSEFLKLLRSKNMLPANKNDRKISTYQIKLLTSEFVSVVKEMSDKYYKDNLLAKAMQLNGFLELSEDEHIKYVTNYLTKELGFSIEEVKYEYNYDENVVVVGDEDYVELTTDAFETLTSLKIKELNDKGVNLASEDIIKYAMIVNIDKLAQDNKDLITTIVGEQLPDEIQEDSYKFSGAVVIYNYNIWYTEGSTKNFIRVSDMIFDETARNKVIQIENRIDEIALTSKTDVKKMNELINKLLKDLLDPECELSYLESGVGFLLQIMLEPIRGLWGMDLYGNIVLDEANAELIKYFVPYPGDEQEYIDNNMLTGYLHDIHNILADCPMHIRELGK